MFIGGVNAHGDYCLSFDASNDPATSIYLDFATEPAVEEAWRGRNGPPISIGPHDVFVTKYGWIIPDYGTTAGKYVWFLPLADLKKYLRENPAALPMIEAYEKKNGTILLPKDPP